MSSAAQSFDNDNGVVVSDLRANLRQQINTTPASTTDVLLKQLGVSMADFSRAKAMVNDNGVPQSDLALELASGSTAEQPLTIEQTSSPFVGTVVAGAERTATLVYDNDLPQSELAKELKAIMSTHLLQPQRVKQAKALLLNEVDTQHAGLIDALNAFDAGDDDAALDGNLAVAPTLEQYYY